MKGGAVIERQVGEALCKLARRRSGYRKPVLQSIEYSGGEWRYKGEKMSVDISHLNGTSEVQRVKFIESELSYSFLYIPRNESSVACSVEQRVSMSEGGVVIPDRTMTLNDLPSLPVSYAMHITDKLQKIADCMKNNVPYLSLRPDNVLVSCGEDGKTELFLDLTKLQNANQTVFDVMLPGPQTRSGKVSKKELAKYSTFIVTFQLLILFFLLTLNHNSTAFKYIKEVYNIPYEETDFFSSDEQELPVLPLELSEEVFSHMAGYIKETSLYKNDKTARKMLESLVKMSFLRF